VFGQIQVEFRPIGHARALVFAAALVAAIGLTAPSAFARTTAATDLRALSIEELANVEITSVSRRPEPLGAAPAAVFLITNDDIRRSGALALPDVLRLAPNLQVARSGAGSWAVTARGFNHNTSTANKLQVLIDGRSVYNSLFSGVFWDVQNVVLADVDRIEVISGPGGALWGSNAVNGVINVVTKAAQDTQGLLVDGAYGGVDQALNVRYGGRLSDQAAVRVYGLGMGRGHSLTASGAPVADGWRMFQGGLRGDWTGARDAVTIQGDGYRGSAEDVRGAVAETRLSGGDILTRWVHTADDGATLDAKAFYDRRVRALSSGVSATVDTWDVEIQRHVSWRGNDLVAGAGYRLMKDQFARGPNTSYLDPAMRALRLANVFLQDEMPIASDVNLTLGLKYEHNSYTGGEWMPDARLA
jgi:iron complex outermembrane receptor protein